MNRAGVVFKKELRDLLRDRKTILVSILLPLVMFPLMFMGIGKATSANTKKVEENFNITIKGAENSQFVSFIRSEEKIKLKTSKNLEQDVKDGNLLLALEVPDNIDSLILEEKQAGVKIIYDNTSQQSMMAQSIIENYIQQYSKEVVSARLQQRNMDPSILTPIMLEYKTTAKEEEGLGKMMLAMMLPMFLVLYSITGPMGSAVDLGAGEKERGTLEPLLTTKVGRMSLLWGKFGAISVIGFLATVFSLIGIGIAFIQGGKSGMDMALSASSLSSIGVKGMVLIFLITILLTLVFGSLELAISIYARSFKEAQTYLAPLNIIAIVPTFLTYTLDARNIDGYYFHIPIANVVCIIKEIISGVFNTGHILTTFAWILVYIAAAILFARFMFSREEVIFRT